MFIGKERLIQLVISMVNNRMAQFNARQSVQAVVPQPGPSNRAAPVAGPSSAPIAGPSSAPVAGPSSVPVAGPSSVPVAGPSSAPVADPSSAPHWVNDPASPPPLPDLEPPSDLEDDNVEAAAIQLCHLQDTCSCYFTIDHILNDVSLNRVYIIFYLQRPILIYLVYMHANVTNFGLYCTMHK